MPNVIKVRGQKSQPIQTDQPNTFVQEPNHPQSELFNNTGAPSQVITRITITGEVHETAPGSGIFNVTDGVAEIDVDIE
jgi:hypothetical protein